MASSLAVRHGEELLETGDGLNLHTEHFVHPSPKAVIVLVHGYAEHSGRYRHVIERLNQAGYTVYTYDHRGHGRSPGDRAYITRFSDLVDDLDLMMARVKEREPGRKVFLVAHSMGGGIATLHAAGSRELAGLVLSGPMLKIPDDVSPVLQRLSNVIGTVLPRLLTVDMGDGANLTRDEAYLKAFRDDALCYHGKVIARTGRELLSVTRAAGRVIDEIRCPLLVMHGTADRVTDIRGSELLYERAASFDKTFLRYEGFYHELFNEVERERVFTDMIAWLDKHLED